MRALVLNKVKYLNVTGSVHFISSNKPVLLQLLQVRIRIAIIVGKYLGLDFLRSIFQPPFPISYRPQPGKKQPCTHFTFSENVIGEK
jgi:hypothetical protein